MIRKESWGRIGLLRVDEASSSQAQEDLNLTAGPTRSGLGPWRHIIALQWPTLRDLVVLT